MYSPKRALIVALIVTFEALILPFLFILTLIARFRSKKIDIGLGPEPLINNIYHKKALERQGYSAETFASDTYFITQEFDYIPLQSLGKKASSLSFPFKVLYRLRYTALFIRVIFRYRALYIYFNGGPLGFNILHPYFEPLLYKIARVKTVVMPYGGDLFDPHLCRDLYLKHVMAQQYPEHRFRKKKISRQLHRWSQHADHVFGGCDWVYYMSYWDTLQLGHFSIDTDEWLPKESSPSKTLKILHAPNHRLLKGSDALITAVKQLQNEGLPIELTLIEKQPNSVVKENIAEADLIVDQLVIGWYAMFCIEAMAMAKPVICFIDPTLETLYQRAGIITAEELPHIRSTVETITDTLRDIVENKNMLKHIGERSRAFVVKHHSLENIGKTFKTVNESIGLHTHKTG